jgi:uncharacterized protein (TIGR00106 family)
MLFSLTTIPVGSGPSILEPVSEVIREIDRSGLSYEVSGMDTVIEGDWDEVMPVIRRAEAELRRHHERVFMVLTMDDHVGAVNRLHGAIEDVEHELGQSVA